DNRWQPILNAVLLVDSGYPVKQWLIPPILWPATDAEHRFNVADKKTPRIVENSFGILKKRFACLEKLHVDPKFSGEIVKCCCILQNMILDDGDDEELSEDDEVAADPNIEPEDSASSSDDDNEDNGNNRMCTSSFAIRKVNSIAHVGISTQL
uniref:DDE Tnp4 domain-containing protein n=1 Tax=Romanomermis culicivorax TaxID=13658 RepID=A0A915KBX7_ROMCU